MSFVKEKNLERFKGYTKDLLFYIKKEINPQNKTRVSNAFKKYMKMDKQIYLRSTLGKLEPYIDFILKSDEIIFTPEYQKENDIKYLDFLPGFDFRVLWRQNLSFEQKNIIFRYLTYLYLQASMALGRNKPKVKAIVENLKTITEIEKEAAENPNIDGEGGATSLKDLFGDDSILLDIATELTQEIDLQATLQELAQGVNMQTPQAGQNPLEMVGQLLQNPKLQEKLAGLQQKMHNKINEKEISEDDLKKSFTNLQDNLANQLGNMLPGGKSQIKKMMKNMNFEAMFQQMSEAQAAGQAIPQASFRPAGSSSSSSTPPPPLPTASTPVPPARVESLQPPSPQEFQNFMNQMMTQNPQMQEMMNHMNQMAQNQVDQETETDAEQLHANHFQQFLQGMVAQAQTQTESPSQETPKIVAPKEEKKEEE